MYIRQRATLKASEKGKILINQARKKKGRIIEDEYWLEEAIKILKEFYLPPDIRGVTVALATWKRFLQAKDRIDPNTFKAFCQVLGLKWEDVVEDVVENAVECSRDLREAPPLSSFYGRTQERTELKQWLFQKRCRLVVIHGVGGIGKSALARQLIKKITDEYDYLIWRSLESAPPFQQLLTGLVEFLSKGEKNDGDISQLMQYLRQDKCLLVLDAWEEITDNNSEDYRSYSEFIERVARERHKSCLLLLSREKPRNIEPLEGELVCFQKLGLLDAEDVKKILKAEGLSGTENELNDLSKRYRNPWIVKKIAKRLDEIFDNEISDFTKEISIYIDDVITVFLDRQFQRLSEVEKNIIYWIAIRRNSASWEQLKIDTRENFSYNEILIILRSLIESRALVDKNKIKTHPILYTLDLVTLKYITNQFVEENFHQIIRVINSQVIHGSELFTSHSFITEPPEDDELNQQQIRRIVKPIQLNLYANLGGPQQVEEELKKILSLLEDRGLSQGYARQNILHLLEQPDFIC